MDKTKTKMICGFLHYLVPCWGGCGLIWTQNHNGNVCKQCLPRGDSIPITSAKVHVGNHHPSMPESEEIYNYG